MKQQCPCHSGKPYPSCCKPFHQGSNPPNALLLMRSRYAAYALSLADYIIQTTHPLNPHYQQNPPKWRLDILHFTQQTAFLGLKIIEFIGGNTEAFMTFTATLQLKHSQQDVSFTEKSSFLKLENHWLYRDGQHRPH